MNDRPMCAVCQRPVEKITRWNRDYNDMATFVVECHGAAEQCEISAFQLSQGAEFGVAFHRTAIEAPASPAADSRTAADLSTIDAA